MFKHNHRVGKEVGLPLQEVPSPRRQSGLLSSCLPNSRLLPFPPSSPRLLYLACIGHLCFFLDKCAFTSPRSQSPGARHPVASIYSFLTVCSTNCPSTGESPAAWETCSNVRQTEFIVLTSTVNIHSLPLRSSHIAGKIMGFSLHCVQSL